MSPAFVRASYVMIALGVAGIPVGIYSAMSGSPVLGALVAVIGLAAAGLAVAKLRTTRHWPFS